MLVAVHHFQILGIRFRVEFGDPEPAEQVTGLLAPFLLPERVPVRSLNTFTLAERERNGQTLLRLYRGCGHLAQSERWDRLVQRVCTEINAAAVNQFKGFAAHAGVVAANGAAIAFPATSGGGKSTLTAAGVLAGFEYVSDEALCLARESGRVLPYPKPIELFAWSRAALALEESAEDDGLKLSFTAEDLGSTNAEEELALEHIVIPELSEARAQLTEGSPTDAFGALLGMSFNMYKRPEEYFRLIGTVANRARAWRLVYQDPLEAAELLRRSLP